MYYLLLIPLFLTTTQSSYVISVYGDVYQNQEFFNKTFPWIIDNIGGEILVEYYMMGSGRHSIPQMCALKELKNNPFVQAQYLKCEALGYQSEYCLCETGVDPRRFKQCVASGGQLANIASAKFSQLGIDVTPVIEIGSKNTVFGVEDSWYLKKICTIFGQNQPLGCLKPFDCNSSVTFANKKPLAHFDRACQKEFPVMMNEEKPTTPWPLSVSNNFFNKI